MGSPISCLRSFSNGREEGFLFNVRKKGYIGKSEEEHISSLKDSTEGLNGANFLGFITGIGTGIVAGILFCPTV